MRLRQSGTAEAVPSTLPPTAAAVRGLLASHRRTQRELATVLGITQSNVSKRLTGQAEFSASDVLAIAEWLDVPAGRVLGEPIETAKGA
jgi:transcriptional regulator with XRE-family HTH domain